MIMANTSAPYLDKVQKMKSCPVADVIDKMMECHRKRGCVEVNSRQVKNSPR